MENRDYKDEHYVLTPYGILAALCEDYNIDISHLTPRMGDHFLMDLIELLIKQMDIGKVPE